ncbi:MAG: PilZ domain-containing protein [Sphingopyxis sp.]|uniref:PilZ domain-containing protein n=1 Tax=Sphingopyxis sp. TaxID=1908224 RepID=UPI002AB93541|nr:PilZ domain-containing protein [Sphingopyxis sp.]MDZ3830401.1 PilZ domain-containing protein [Sphingopyxis sp.]
MLGNENSTDRTPAATDEARRASRSDVRARARLREAGRHPFDADLFDLSSTGFRFFSYSPPAIGTRLWVNLPGLQLLEAVVRRIDGTSCGCEFASALHPSVTAHLQSSLR